MHKVVIHRMELNISIKCVLFDFAHIWSQNFEFTMYWLFSWLALALTASNIAKTSKNIYSKITHSLLAMIQQRVYGHPCFDDTEPKKVFGCAPNDIVRIDTDIFFNQCDRNIYWFHHQPSFDNWFITERQRDAIHFHLRWDWQWKGWS